MMRPNQKIAGSKDIEATGRLKEFYEKMQEEDSEEEEISGAVDVIPLEEGSEEEAVEKPAVDEEKPATEVQGSEKAETEVDEKEASEPAYQANLKFIANDQEHEFPEWAREFISNPEKEAKFRELFERSVGLDGVKERHKETKEKLHNVTESFNGLQSTVQNTLALVKEGVDNRSDEALQLALEQLGISQQRVLEFAVNRAKAAQNPEQAAHYQRQVESFKTVRERDSELASLNSQVGQMAVQMRERDLDMELSRPEVSELAKAFDARQGNGAFRQEIINRGAMAFFTSKKDLSPRELVDQMMSVYGTLGAQAAPPKAVEAPTKDSAKPANPPVIPNVRGTANVPVKKQFTKIADLRKEYEAMKRLT